MICACRGRGCRAVLPFDGTNCVPSSRDSAATLRGHELLKQDPLCPIRASTPLHPYLHLTPATPDHESCQHDLHPTTPTRGVEEHPTLLERPAPHTHSIHPAAPQNYRMNKTKKGGPPTRPSAKHPPRRPLTLHLHFRLFREYDLRRTILRPRDAPPLVHLRRQSSSRRTRRIGRAQNHANPSPVPDKNRV